jgi:anti-sigma-K factor RskA
VNPIDKHPEWELVEDYVLDFLDAGERAAFEARLATDPALAREVRDAREALSAMALASPVTPPPALKERVLAQVAAEAAAVPDPRVLPLRPGHSRLPIWLGAALAASLLLVVKLERDRRNLEGTVASMLVSAEQHLYEDLERDSLIARLVDPGVEMVTLAATGEEKPVVRTYLDRAGKRGVLAISSLKAPPAGQTYQLWFIVEGNPVPVPSITFAPDAEGKVFIPSFSVPEAAGITVAVTQEPTGGSVSPTMPILFVGATTSR